MTPKNKKQNKTKKHFFNLAKKLNRSFLLFNKKEECL